jgi:hypothetical protein
MRGADAAWTLVEQAKSVVASKVARATMRTKL